MRNKTKIVNNSADPWNIYGVGFGRESKADSEKVAWEVRSTTEDLPTGQKDPDDATLVVTVNDQNVENSENT